MAGRYIPKQGEVVWLDFNPQTGHEQAGRRPALVLSPLAYNRKTGLMLCCPMTNQVKGHPFEVSMAEVKGITGVAPADHKSRVSIGGSGARKRKAVFLKK